MKQYLPLFFILLLTATSSAQAFNGRYAPTGQATENPVQTIQNALNKLQAFNTNSKKANPKLLRGFIEKEIIPHFAFDQMTYWIAGPYARYMNAVNLKELEDKVKKTFLNSMSTHLGNYDANSSRVNFRPVQYRGYNDANVTAFISRPSRRPDQLEFRMKAQGNSWKIIDVKANGISAAQYYRKHFISILRQYR